jgi:hypothetical protein
MLPDNDPTTVTPNAPAYKYNTFYMGADKFALINQTVSPIPTDQARLTLGVGEQVVITLTNISQQRIVPQKDAALVRWTTSAGSVYPTNGSSTTLTAPSNAATATVTMSYGAMAHSIDFTVIEPTGVDHAAFLQYGTYTSTTLAGAGVQLRPYIGPMNVSFYQVQIMEVGQDASGTNGYFVFHTPPNHDDDHGANQPIYLGYDNHWLGDDWATSYGWAPPWYASGWIGGSYTWNIPAVWSVGTGQTNPLSGWNQVHTLGPDGTMTVTKFGHSVSRTIQGNYSGH